MTKHAKARLIGLGSYLPQNVLTNQDLEKMVDTSDEWITSRTGMKERRIAGKGEFASTMGTQAARQALERAGVEAAQLDLILVSTMSPDYISPSTSNLIQAQLGASQAFSLDIQAACSGFLYALSIAKAYIEAGMYQTILVIATEKMSSFVNYQDRNTCVLFGDGAAAAVVTNHGAGLAIEALCLGSDGTLADLVMIPAGGARQPATLETVKNGSHYFTMVGREVFKHAVRRMSAAAKDCLEKLNLQESDIDWLVPHQANQRIMDALAKQFNMSTDKVYRTVHKYGNTSSSGVAIALDELIQEQTLQKNARLLLVAFGGGLTWGACILSKIEG